MILNYIDTNGWTGMGRRNEEMLSQNIWNGVHLEEEEKEDFEICGWRG